MRSRSSDEHDATTIAGGVDARRPANRVPPSRSPDISNITFDRHSAASRGGFPAFVEDFVPGSAVRNRCHKSKTQIADPAAPDSNPALVPEIDAIYCPGRMVAGNREVYRSLINGYTLDFFCSPEDLTLEHAANGGDEFVNNPFPVNANGAYDILMRPIISKGHSKNSMSVQFGYTEDEFGPLMTHGGAPHRGSIHWATTSAWGPQPEFIEIASITFLGGTSYRITTIRPHGLTAAVDSVKIIATAASTCDGVHLVTATPSTTQFDIATGGGSAVVTQVGVVVKALEASEQTYGCPFFVHLGRTAPSTTWEFRFSFHIINGANFEIVTISNPTPVIEGAKYHILASYDPGGFSMLRVGIWDEDQQAFVYTTALDGAQNRVLCTPSSGPIVVFDVNQAMTDAGSVPAATWNTAQFTSIPPGFGLRYWTNSVRFAGLIEDIVIWRDPIELDVDETARDRVANISAADHPRILSHWSMQGTGERYCLEQTGLGNHLYMSPDTPIIDEHSGGKGESASSAFFNGETSYALVSTDGNPNWRQIGRINYLTDGYGIFEQAVRASGTLSTGFGLSVEFWVESIESFEQVLVEVQHVMRIAIRNDGRLAVYVRGAESNSVSATAPSYQLPAVSPDPVVIGARYHVVGWKSGFDTQLYVNGELVATFSGLPISQTGCVIGGLVIGAGARRWGESGAAIWHKSITSPYLAIAGEPTSDQVNTDARSHFFGRIEQVSVLVGSPTKKQSYADEDFDDSIVESTLLWDVTDRPGVGLNKLEPANLGDRTPEIGDGYAARPANHFKQELQKRILYFVGDKGGGTVLPSLAYLDDGGADALVAARVNFAHEIARYTFSASDVDRITTGRFAANVEFRTSGSAGDRYRYIYEFTSNVTDDLDVLGSLLMRCAQPLQMTESDSGFVLPTRNDPAAHYRNVPLLFRSPREIGPAWASGLAVPKVGKSPVTLIRGHVTLPGERVILVGGEHSLYEARPLWSTSNPFGDPNRRSLSSYRPGRRGFAVVGTSTSADPTLELTSPVASSTIFVHFWVRPLSLRGNRFLAGRGSPDSGRFNWAIWAENGSLHVGGAGSPTTTGWHVEQAGRANLKKGAWNHVAILMGAAGVGTGVWCWVNGEPISMTSVAAAAAIGTVTPLTGGRVFLTGLPNGYRSILISNGGNDIGSTADPFEGEFCEFVLKDAEDSSFEGWTSVPSAGEIPRAAAQDDADTQLLIRFDETRGRSVANDSANHSSLTTKVRHPDLVTIRENLRSSAGRVYSSVIFNDRVYATNGTERPLEIAFKGRTNRAGAFAVWPLGIQLIELPRDLVIEFVHAPLHPDSDVSATSYLGDGLYNLFMAAVDEDDRESEPIQLALNMEIGAVHSTTIATIALISGTTYRITMAAAHDWASTTTNTEPFTAVIRDASVTPQLNGVWKCDPDNASNTQFLIDFGVTLSSTDPSGAQLSFFWDGVRIKGLPRSEDPQVVARKFYLSAFGGGPAVAHSKILDNDSYSCELLGPGGSFGDFTPAVFELRLPAPRARLIEVAAGTGVMALLHLTDAANGANAFAWNDSLEASYWPLSNAVVVPSNDAEPIIGARAHRGRFYVMSRRAIWTFAFAGTGQLAPVNQTVGFGGGLISYDDGFYGVGDRGIHRFDGANQVFISKALQDLWDIPLTTDDLMSAQGAFGIVESQYLVSVRIGSGNRKVYVLQTTITNDEGEFPISVWDVPEHTFMTDVIDPATLRPTVLIGTTSGRLIAYSRDQIVDVATDDGDLSFSASPSIAGRAMTISGLSIQDDLHGCPVFMAITVGGVLTEFESSVEFNRTSILGVATVILADDIPTPDPGTQVLVVLGGFDSYWTTGWVSAHPPGSYLSAERLDIEFSPSECELTVDNAAAVASPNSPPIDVTSGRSFPTSAANFFRQALDLSLGFTGEPVKLPQSSRGRYIRVRIGTWRSEGSGVRSPWSVSRLSLTISNSNQRPA